VSQAIKYIYINLNIGYGNETDSLLQRNFLVCKLIITWLTITHKVYVSIDAVQYTAVVAVTGLMTTDAL